MSLSQLGIHFIVGLSGTELTSDEREALSNLKPAGIILFGKNIDKDCGLLWKDRLRSLIDSAKNATGNDKLLVSIDHEGGRVHRFPEGITHFPPAVQWEDRTEDVARTMARELSELGFNLSYAPVLDVFSEPKNSVIGDRAFGTTPAIVIKRAREFFRGFAAEGMIGCAKHFPGHGATVADSHFELPHLDASEDILNSRELVPYRVLLKEDIIPTIMTAHVNYPALDQDNPATLSWPIVTGLLRHELGFNGVVVSDDLEMHALKYLTPEERGIAALLAGCDILLEANSKELSSAIVALSMAEAIDRALTTVKLDEQALHSSKKKISKLVGMAKF